MGYKDGMVTEDGLVPAEESEFRQELDLINHALASAISRWKVYKGLFASDPQRVDVLNEASPMVSRVIQDALFSEILMRLCRLTDPAESGRGAGARRNLSLFALERHLQGETRDQYRVASAAAKISTAFARDWRNRSIAHADVDVATERAVLDDASVEGVENAFSQLAEALNVIHSGVFNSTFAYDKLILPFKDERAFIHRILLGNQARKEQMRRLEELRIAQRFPEWEEEHGKALWPDWLKQGQ